MNPNEREGQPKYYTMAVSRIINGDSRAWATETGSNTVKSEHLFLALLNYSRGVIPVALRKMGIDSRQLTSRVIEKVTEGKGIVVPEVLSDIGFSDDVREIVEDSQTDTTSVYVAPQHLMLNILLREGRESTMGLEQQGLTYQSFRDTLLGILPNIPRQRII